MKIFTVRLNNDLHSEALAKAKLELRSLNAIIGRLIEKWVAGEVDLLPPKSQEGQPKQT